MNRLEALQKEGQAVWMDFIRRGMLRDGELERLVEEGLSGVTSNPAIFQKAMGEGSEYDGQIRELLARDPHLDTVRLYEELAIRDIQQAADILRPVYDSSEAADGYVSFEVSPHLAHDTEGTVEEARRLWQRVDRPNLMIKVPSTPEGVPAMETLLSEAINVNATLMFSLSHLEAVTRAYLEGLARCSRPQRVASVASFFVSRVDSKVDPLLEEQGTEEALALRGKIAIANSKMAYRFFRRTFHGEGFAPLRERGARVQRVLWASTSTKNPDYSDVLYVDELIGPDTVNTMTPATIDAFRDHGTVRRTLDQDLQEAERQLGALEGLGIDLDRVTEELQVEGVRKFAEPFDVLLASLESKREELSPLASEAH